jgi:predicted metal-dependent hydrolase
MLGRGKHPPGALQLVDAAEALQPGAVDEVLLRCLARHSTRPALRDAKVSVDGVAGKVDSRVLGRRLGHLAIIPMTAGLQRGIDLFNSGRYWDAHEAWELEWMPDRQGPDAGFYKGLIQVAAGCLHYGRQNRRGTLNKWRSGADYLRPYLPSHRGVLLSPLVVTVDQFLAAMQPREWPELTMPKIVQE